MVHCFLGQELRCQSQLLFLSLPLIQSLFQLCSLSLPFSPGPPFQGNLRFENQLLLLCQPLIGPLGGLSLPPSSLLCLLFAFSSMLAHQHFSCPPLLSFLLRLSPLWLSSLLHPCLFGLSSLWLPFPLPSLHDLLRQSMSPPAWHFHRILQPSHALLVLSWGG